MLPSATLHRSACVFGMISPILGDTSHLARRTYEGLEQRAFFRSLDAQP